MDSYLTLKHSSTSLFKDLGSKHFGYAFRVSEREEVSILLNQLKEENSKANHICYAYRILNTENDEIIAYSTDDGEPSNSAGPPILGQLESNDLLNCVIFVVRYFGGKKLGVSGLINAYKTAAALAIQQAEITKAFVKSILELNVPFANYHVIIDLLKKFESEIIEEKHNQQGTTLIIEIPRLHREEAIKELQIGEVIVQSSK